MHTSNAGPMLASRTTNAGICYGDRYSTRSMRHEVRAERRYEQQRWLADLAAELEPEQPATEPGGRTYDDDLADLYAEIDLWDAIDAAGLDAEYADDEVTAWLADNAEQAAAERAARIADRYTLDPSDLPGWDAPTVLVFNDWQDNDTVGIYGLESDCIL